MKTNIRKFPAVLLLAVLCLTVFPISAMAAGVAEVKIPVSVELSGEKPSPDETYTIILQGEDEAPMPEENTITITGAGKAEFPAVEYAVPGVYTYSVSQQPGKLENGHYDNTVYYVKVTVTNGESGDLEAVVAAHTDAQMNSEKQDIGFVNSCFSLFICASVCADEQRETGYRLCEFLRSCGYADTCTGKYTDTTSGKNSDCSADQNSGSDHNEHAGKT